MNYKRDMKAQRRSVEQITKDLSSYNPEIYVLPLKLEIAGKSSRLHIEICAPQVDGDQPVSVYVRPKRCKGWCKNFTINCRDSNSYDNLICFIQQKLEV